MTKRARTLARSRVAASLRGRRSDGRSCAWQALGRGSSFRLSIMDEKNKVLLIVIYITAILIFIGTSSSTPYKISEDKEALAMFNQNIAEDSAKPGSEAVPIVSDNVPNPSLEQVDPTKNMPLAWDTDSYGKNEPVFTYEDTGRKGEKSIKVELLNRTSGEARWYFYPQPIEGGKNYEFGDWYESNVVTHVYIKCITKDGRFNIKLNDAPPAETWTQYLDAIFIPSNVTAFTVMHSIDKVGSLTTDLYSMTDTSYTDSGTVMNHAYEKATWGSMETPTDDQNVDFDKEAKDYESWYPKSKLDAFKQSMTRDPLMAPVLV